MTVAEGGTAEFQVKLNTEPLNPTTVTVSRASGDTDISVQSGASLVFDASNWNTNQTVTLAAASDADQVDGSAIIRCSAPETADQDVTATEAGQHTGAGDRDEHECGDGGGRRYGEFQVKLNTQPMNPTTVTVSRASGDTDISVQSGASLVFDASNWNTNQTVTLSAASDADQVDGSAIIRCSAPETADQDVTATEAGQHAGAGDRDEHECGDGGGRRYGDLRGSSSIPLL